MLKYLITLLFVTLSLADQPRSISGIYPTLAMFNKEGECGTGAVVPWADRLWVITYGPHLPFGSSDKLYEITPELTQIIRPESIGGTPANRMIHPESNQLFIGPYVIDANRNVRTIPFTEMPGRLTGNARHLTHPAEKIYYATMEEGLYEVDVKTLSVTTLIKDSNKAPEGVKPTTAKASNLPGYHGKGLYSSQGALIYANNGDRDPRVKTDPTTPSGALAEWRGEGDWKMIRRNQFTEVTGPGGITGSPADSPIWSIGWDAKSLILMTLEKGQWHSFRLPKVIHSYDGAHGWNTEWPRIRDIGEKQSLMTMHGAFWSFPKTFSASNPNGIRPRSAYLKVIGDFCRWNDKLVFGCDDSAASEFLNKRSIKGGINSIGQSQSNLWFTSPDTLDKLGPAPASGALWLHEKVSASQKSDPFLIAGWAHRSLWLIDHSTNTATRRDITETSDWLTLQAEKNSNNFSAIVTLSNDDTRSYQSDQIFQGIASATDEKPLTGLFRPSGDNKRTLAFATNNGYYEMGADLKLTRVEDAKSEKFTRENLALTKNTVTLDDASVLITDDRNRRWRIPRATSALDEATNNTQLRLCREVATERDMLNLCGTLFELPAENADGFAKIRPIASHNLRITDFGSYRGLLLISGIKSDGQASEHILRSDDGKAALWAGAVDDLWKLGKPHGFGGPWKDTKITAQQASDSYLFWAYDKRKISLHHDSNKTVNMKIELDLTGTGIWVNYQNISVPANEKISHIFPQNIHARWLRVTADQDCTATAQLTYE